MCTYYDTPTSFVETVTYGTARVAVPYRPLVADLEIVGECIGVYGRGVRRRGLMGCQNILSAEI